MHVGVHRSLAPGRFPLLPFLARGERMVANLTGDEVLAYPPNTGQPRYSVGFGKGEFARWNEKEH